MVYQQPSFEKRSEQSERKRENQEPNKVRGETSREHMGKEGNKPFCRGVFEHHHVKSVRCGRANAKSDRCCYSVND